LYNKRTAAFFMGEERGIESMFTDEKLANPEFFAENRLPAHSDHKWYRDAAELLRDASSFVCSLDGLWYFHYARNLGQRPQGFEATDYDVAGWETIRVPAHWQLEGHGAPQYTNMTYPWDGHEVVHPGEVPQRSNPVGSYVKYFTLPAEWDNAFLSLQGVESAVVVWCNGQYVGYSEDSFTPSDFNLTPYLQAGENKLALQVYRFSSGSWIEDQDFWRFSGIFRDVRLYTKPMGHIDDIFVHAVPANEYESGDLTIDLAWHDGGEKQVALQIYEPDGQLLTDETFDCQGESSKLHLQFAKVDLWSAEHPNLYRAMLSVRDKAGRLLEVVPLTIGFREFKLEDGLMKINGKRIVFKGVNRHEFDCWRGRAMNPADFERDIQTMKRHNINALRCSHYPNSSYIYALCDRYGLYVIDETNLETHGSWQKNGVLHQDETTVPNDHPEWQAIVLDRAKSMLQRDKNHASIIIWSCGNESCGGKDIYEMSQYFRKTDPSRLVHYESIFWDRRYNATSDMESQMYTPVAGVKKFLAEHKEKPFMLCEYTHAMGNSIGGMHKYTELTDVEPRFQGGFIWDFVDQALMHKDGRGKIVPGYGGDFGDRSHDGNFSGDGILFTDRGLTSKLQDVKFNYQNFTLDVTAEKLTIHNKSLFTDTGDFDLHLQLAVDGEVVWQTTMPAPYIAPGQQGELALSDILPVMDAGEECLTASLLLRQATLWAETGYEIAFGQGVWQVEESDIPEPSELHQLADYATGRLVEHYQPNVPLAQHKPLHIVRGDINLGVQGEGFEILFSSGMGNIVSYKYNGEELLESLPVPSFWRAPVDNDYGSRRDFALAQWKLASLYRRCVKKEMLIDDEWREFNWFGQLGWQEYEAAKVSVRFTYEFATQPMSQAVITYTVQAGGTVQVALDYDKVEGLPEIPDFAMLFQLSEKYHQLRFYGFGPQDNYADRQEGAKLGIWQSETHAEVQPYLQPQESGNHNGVRWFEVTDERGRGLRVEAEQPVAATALPWNAHELENARHGYDLVDSQHTWLRVSAGQSGVGGDDTWGAPVLPEYTQPNEDKHLVFTIRGI